VSGSLLTVVAAYLLLVATLASAAALGARVATAVWAGVVVGQVLLVVQALVDAGTLLTGHRPGELATHLGYLVASVLMLPLLVSGASGGFGRSGVRGPGATRTDHLVVALAAAVTVVVSVRLHATWRS
jgi:hypothetical protein